jgi:hypothetical protein
MHTAYMLRGRYLGCAQFELARFAITLIRKAASCCLPGLSIPTRNSSATVGYRPTSAPKIDKTYSVDTSTTNFLKQPPHKFATVKVIPLISSTFSLERYRTLPSLAL